MVSSLTNRIVTVLGGDKRDCYVVRAFLDEGADVRTVGVPMSPDMTGASAMTSPIAAVRGAHCVVGPISGTHPGGQLRVSELPVTVDETLIDAMLPGAAFIIGTVPPSVAQACQSGGIRLIQYGNLDEVAVLNSIPSAEGAIQMIMAETPITIHGAQISVLGMGRTGVTLAHKLRNLGARVTVFARKPVDLARADALDLPAMPYRDLETTLASADVIVNTVPALMLTRRALERLRTDCFVLDLASTPGGVDYEAARELGVKALLAPGLPGRVAPKTAGMFLARILPRLAKAELDLA